MHDCDKRDELEGTFPSRGPPPPRHLVDVVSEHDEIPHRLELSLVALDKACHTHRPCIVHYVGHAACDAVVVVL